MVSTGTARSSINPNVTTPIAPRWICCSARGSAITAPAPAAASSRSADCYDGHCRDLQLGPQGAAIRLRQTAPVYGFHDRLQGELHADPALAGEDFIIRRRDGLFAYNLAVVIDDHFQGVTEIVRGADLIEPTVRQIALYRQLQAPVPAYVHLPLALGANGIKLSKQNHAPALPAGDPRPVLIAALKFLRQPLPESWQDLDLPLLLSWAVAHWRLENVPRQEAIPLDENTPAFSKEPW